MTNKSLRIFYAAHSTCNPFFKGVTSNIWRINLYEPLVDLGHDVVEFAYDLDPTIRHVDFQNPVHAAFIAANRPRVSAELLRQIKAAHAQKPIDVFFSYFYSACVLPETLDEIRRMGIVTINWYCNGSYQLHLVSEIAPHYSWCLVPEKFRLADYKALDANPIYCQEAVNPNHYKWHDIPYDHDVTFIGQSYGDRPEILRFLYESGLPVIAYGLYWRPRQPLAPEDHRFHIPEDLRRDLLTDEEFVQMACRSKINLGFSTCGDTHKTGQPIYQVRARDFEIPMSGGFYVVQHQEELAEFYDLGSEIVTYTDRYDLRDKIRYYLAHDTQREQIRRAGYDRCRRDHSFQKRFTDVFHQIGLL